ncbi:gamma-type small acid-soluble spore protein [Lysinibacillus capsici]|uniref:Small, acid-soluble spore protein gamma-type n=1 Tax=Lysinibacillus capsici TaxID=2115968 RepID=A0ABY8KLR5_9BACI|nr:MULTISPECIES: gamma-type small acid-soluble spore protein [Lysinibacillus]MCS5499561.1 gamma-type small acid-soluble spore protein [Lysinibacillus sp. A4]MCT1646481.1 gamma-type small acid-soluble spore protein [Lysinibacillus capsici]MDP1393511.1 gamma-type small acid-soluble spore protein [Lysinibacillus capsici]MDP1414287.1 gamma-type small acid-soluble spore protein [Lysinibacillus capsici]MDP1430179.1 gamma-type small acid-soluble spore protein [Lysinibacillus capsici]
MANNNNNQNFNSKIPNAAPNAMNSMNVEFGNETDVNQIRQQIQQAEAKKQQASGSMNAMKSTNVEFGNETDVNQIRQQIQQAEANKKFASGKFANENNSK